MSITMIAEAAPDHSQIQAEVSGFLARFKTLVLATLSEAQLPDCSTAPFLLDKDGNIYVYLSELAQHTKNLLANPAASLMMIADETASNNLFARQRLTLQANAVEIAPGNPEYEHILDNMESELGNTIQVLRTLPDFHLFKFLVQRANYVQGFAKAYALQWPALEVIEHRHN